MEWVIVQSPHGELNHCIRPGAERTPCGCRAKGWQFILPRVGEVLRPSCKRCDAAMKRAALKNQKLAKVEDRPSNEEIPSCCIS